MERPESDRAYLARCTESCLDTLAEARTLALDGNDEDRLARALHFARDLLDIIEDGLDEPEHDPAARGTYQDMRDQLTALSFLLSPSATLQ